MCGRLDKDENEGIALQIGRIFFAAKFQHLHASGRRLNAVYIVTSNLDDIRDGQTKSAAGLTEREQRAAVRNPHFASILPPLDLHTCVSLIVAC